jgi:hypothetical protein
MVYSMTPGLLNAYPTLDELLTEIKRVCCALDRDISTRDLRVEARRNPSPQTYNGWAYPVTRLVERHRTTYHRDGLVRMWIGAQCCEEDIIRLYAHELRHIGQFHRGRKRYGNMTIHPLTEVGSEDDAESFEARVLERML